MLFLYEILILIVDKEFLQNIDVNKILHQLEFCISNRAMMVPAHCDQVVTWLAVEFCTMKKFNIEISMIIFREKCTGRFYSEGVRDFNKCINTCASPFGDIATISLFNTIEGGNITAIFVFNRAVEADF